MKILLDTHVLIWSVAVLLTADRALMAYGAHVTFAD